jgi:hypothetical protein
MDRTLLCKFVRFKAGRRKNFLPPSIEGLIRRIFTHGPTVRDRHVPPILSAQLGDSCVFLNRKVERRRGKQPYGVIFEVGSYVRGHVPEQAAREFQKAELDVTQIPLVTTAGVPREVITRYRCLALGNTLIIELVRGGGGADELAVVLSQLIRFHCDDTLPNIALEDVAAATLERAIAAGGGIDRVTARIARNVNNDNLPYTTSLSQIRSKLAGAARVTVEWESHDNDQISTRQALNAMAEQSTGGLMDSITLHLKDGGRIDRLKRYRERRVVSVAQARAGGGPVISEIETALWNYIDELRTLDDDDWRLLDDNGMLIGGSLVLDRGN